MTDQQFIQWLKDESALRCVLMEVDVSVDGVETTRYLSNIGYVTKAADTPSNTVYVPLIAGGVQFTETISLEGATSLSYGDIELYNTSGDKDSWLEDVWSNRTCKIYIGDAGWVKSEFRKIFDGVVVGIDSRRRDRINIKLSDKLQRLNTVVSETKLGGTTSNKDRILPLCFGECHNIEPLLVDPANHEYQVHNGPIESIIEVRDNGVPVAYTPFLSTGKFRLNQQPVGTITASVQGYISKNLWTFSNDLSQPIWGSGSAIRTANAITAPDGTVTACKFDDTGASAIPSVTTRSFAVTAPSMVVSIYIKTGTAVSRQFHVHNNTLGGAVTGAVLYFADGALQGDPEWGVQNVGNGWYRVYVTLTNLTVGHSLQFYYGRTGGAIGGATDTWYLWGAQLEEGRVLSPYTRSTETFTSRASTATYFDINGVLQVAPANTARIGYDPTDIVSQNLMPWSEDVNNWGAVVPAATLVPNAYNGITGVRITNVYTDSDSPFKSLGGSGLPAGTYTASCIIDINTAVGATYSTLNILGWDTSAVVSYGAIYFAFSTKTLYNPTSVGSATLVDYTATELASGVYRITVTVNFKTAITSARMYANYIGPDVSSGVLIAPQINEGKAAAPYTKTLGTPAPKQCRPIGLILEQASTKCLQANDALDNVTYWPKYNVGTGDTSRQIINDPQMGTVLRLTKTAGAAGDRAGIRGLIHNIGSGSTYTASVYVRRGTTTSTGLAVYVDANKTGGTLLTASAGFNNFSALTGDWKRYEAHHPAGTLAGTGGWFYIWIDSNVGDFIDIKLPDMELGLVMTSPVAYTTTTPVDRAADMASSVQSNIYPTTVAELVKTVVGNYGTDKFSISDMDYISLNEFDAANKQPVGLYVNDRANVLECCNRLATSVGARLAMRISGQMYLVKLGLPRATTGTVVTASDMVEKSLSVSQLVPIVAGIKLGYCKSWLVQNNLQTGLPAEHISMFAEEWLTVTKTDSAVANKYKMFSDPTMAETLLLTEADADAEATRRLNMFSTQRKVVQFDGLPNLMLEELGTSLTLKHERFGLYAGKTGQIVSVQTDWMTSHVQIGVLI